MRAFCTLLLALVVAAPAAAHRLAPSLLEIQERADGELSIRWKTPLQRPAGSELVPVLPAECVATSEPQASRESTSVSVTWTARCEGGGLAGRSLSVRGLAETATNALVRIGLADERAIQAVLHAGAASFVVPERASLTRVFRDYAMLGAGHIANGFDHLLFVFGLLLLVTGGRALVATVTAFTLGHSVTLSLAALGFVRMPTGPIEAVIALTILVLALELVRDPPSPGSWLRRWPWAVASGFGLLHGFGFAGALAEIGLPDVEIPLALFSFNVGIEIGQLVFVGLVLAGRALLATLLSSAPPWLIRVPVYGMGSLAVYWCLDRTAALF